MQDIGWYIDTVIGIKAVYIEHLRGFGGFVHICGAGSETGIVIS